MTVEWLSIDAAPRDGTPIQGRDAEGYIFTCRWWTKQQVAEYEDDDPDNWDGGWLDLFDPDIGYDPVVWQPVED